MFDIYVSKQWHVVFRPLIAHYVFNVTYKL
nr:MAG TPA: hypothetical protein [Caudoviricetes sp.]